MTFLQPARMKSHMPLEIASRVGITYMPTDNIRRKRHEKESLLIKF